MLHRTDTAPPPTRKAVGLIDMDGTIANYDDAMRAALASIASPGEPEVPDGNEDHPPWVEARRTLISTQPGFWRNLARLDAGFDVLNVLRVLDFEIHVLTKGPRKKSIAWTEKQEWCLEHVPDALITITEKKSLVWGRVLVDDWPSYYQDWLRFRPRGLVIVPAQRWNVGAEAHAPGNIFRYDRKDGVDHLPTLTRILRAARDRQPGESFDLREHL